KGAEAKAKALVDNAQRNIDEKGIDSPEQYVENYRSGTPLDERARRIGEDVGEAAENVGEGLSKGAQKNAQQTKSTAQDAAVNTKQAADVGESLGDKIKQAAQDAADAINPNTNSK
ncbi:MAG: hypothetical protein F6K28_42875, partial [Microcoleus sp. SIO2G3]|nr:hypothetical protein [Microcoleus sp. SIO2G3]